MAFTDPPSATSTTAETTHEARLVAIRYVARDINLYELKRTDGAPLAPIAPGAHIDLILPNGLMRQYSVTESGSAPQSYTVAIKRDAQSRGGSRYIHDELRVGKILRIGGPRNNFPLNETAEHSVLIAGGIGITPIWCMVNKLVALGRPFTLHYASRTRDEAAFLTQLQKLSSAKLHFDDESGGKFLDVGAILASAPKTAHLYCCGPGPMLSAFEAATAGWPPDQIHIEYFTAKSAPATAGGFVVELSRSGQQFVIPAGKTILDVLLAAGIDVPFSCEQGICGSCETRVISGLPEHRDSVLTPAEQAANKTMMICCSGCRSDRLVLDL